MGRPTESQRGPTESQRALRRMQQIYELDAALARRQLTAGNAQDFRDAWHAHAAIIKQANRRGARAWAIELLRILAVRYGIDDRVRL